MPDTTSYYTSATSTQETQASLFQLGDESALAFFFNEFYPALSLYGFRLLKDRSTAEDVASEAFVKTWKMHHKLDSYGGIRAYLYKTVQRDCLRIIKQERRRAEVHKLSVAEDSPFTPFQHLVSAETYRLVHAALQTLSPGNRRVLSMHFLEGKSIGQIARELSLHPHTVQTQKTRGLKALRKIIKHPLGLLVVYFLKIFLTRV